jgi:hypothetical protein
MFVNYTPNDKTLGITQKISSEITALRTLGHSVTYTAYADDGVCIYDNEDNLTYQKRYIFKNNAYQAYRRYFLLIETAQSFIENNDIRYDLCYGRLLAPNQKYVKLLNTIKRKGSRVILEAHAYFPGIRFQSLKGKYVSFMLDKNGPKLNSCVNKILTEGHIDDFYGITETQESRIGVETEAILPHKYEGKYDQLNLISVANETTYHAYDRVVRSLAYYYSVNKDAKKIIVHLVGTVSEATKILIYDLKLDKKIRFYGKQYGQKLDAIYNNCNMGLGPFGQHRIGGKKDTGLKTKEYFAKGIPYAYSGDEPSVPVGYPYILQLPSDESMLDFELIWNFYLSYRDDNNVVDNMRQFAIDNYSWKAIMNEAIQ